MYNLRAVAFFYAIALCCAGTVAENTGNVDPDIVTHITADSINEIIQPAALGERLQYDDSPDPDKSENKGVKGRIGYRVQVFSDNNSRTAKNEARAKERRVMSRFPQYRSYVMFKAPYWRLRIGDFRTQQEAASAAEDIKRAFPSYSKEIRVVQDKINL